MSKQQLDNTANRNNKQIKQTIARYLLCKQKTSEVNHIKFIIATCTFTDAINGGFWNNYSLPLQGVYHPKWKEYHRKCWSNPMNLIQNDGCSLTNICCIAFNQSSNPQQIVAELVAYLFWCCCLNNEDDVQMIINTTIMRRYITDYESLYQTIAAQIRSCRQKQLIYEAKQFEKKYNHLWTTSFVTYFVKSLYLNLLRICVQIYIRSQSNRPNITSK